MQVAMNHNSLLMGSSNHHLLLVKITILDCLIQMNQSCILNSVEYLKFLIQKVITITTKETAATHPSKPSHKWSKDPASGNLKQLTKINTSLFYHLLWLPDELVSANSLSTARFVAVFPTTPSTSQQSLAVPIELSTQSIMSLLKLIAYLSPCIHNRTWVVITKETFQQYKVAEWTLF